MAALAIIAAVVLIAAGAGLAWYLDSKSVVVAATALASAVVASAFVFSSPAGPRGGIAVAVQDSCDAASLTSGVESAVRTALAPGVNGNAAVILSWFADNALTAHRVILDLAGAPPASVRGDAVAYANWKAPRMAMAEQAMKKLRTTPCLRVGTSVVGAVEAANDELRQAGVTGRRQIVLVTNLIEYSKALKIQADSFGPGDVDAAVRVISALPADLRPWLGANTSVKVLFVPVFRDNGQQFPIAEQTAAALKTWARRVFRTVLHAGGVRIDVLATDT